MAKGKVVQVIGTVVMLNFHRTSCRLYLMQLKFRVRTGKLFWKLNLICPTTGFAACLFLRPKVWREALKLSIPVLPVRVPVGKATLGRLFNVLGEPLDDLGEVETAGEMADSSFTAFL